MKKLLSLALALCLLCAGAALAEAVTEKTTLQLDGFTLTLLPGEVYQRAEEVVVNQPYLTAFPFAAENDLATNYVIHTTGEKTEYTAEQMKSILSGIEEGLRSGMEAQGIQVVSLNIQDPYDANLNGVSCVVLEYSMELSYSGVSMQVFTRQISVGSVATVFTLTAASEEDMDKLTQRLAEALDFR